MKRGRQGDGGGPKPHVPDDKKRNMVKLMTAVGVTQADIASILGFADVGTLTKHYRYELDLGMAEAAASVGGVIYKRAMAGDAWACTLFAKARMKWVTDRNEHSGPDGGPIVADSSGAAERILARLYRAERSDELREDADEV